MRIVLVWMVALCGFSAARAQSTAPEDSSLQVIKSLYHSGSFLAAEVEARRYLEKPSLPDSLRVAAEQFVAFCLVAQGSTASAVDHFVTILSVDSSYTLDPVLTSPKILSAFEAARQRYAQQQRAAQQAQPPPLTRDVPGPSYRALLFPGWDQLHQGRPTKGYVFLSAGVASLGALVTFDILRRSAREEYLAAVRPEDAAAAYTTYDRYSKAEYYSAAAFLLVYFYSAFDSFLNLPPHFEAAGSTAGGVQLTVRWTL